MPLQPVALFGLEVPCGDVIIPARAEFPASFRITMAAIDPSAEAEVEEGSTARPRATLKILRQEVGDQEDDDDDSEDEAYMRELLGDDSESDSEEEEEANGGPSDPTKSKKAKKQAAMKQLLESIKSAADDSDEEMEGAANGVNGTKKASKKGKAVATTDVDEESEESDEEEDLEIEEFVICTLDPEKNYQQTLDITIGENELVYFKVTGTHAIYLTGNYIVEDDGHNHHHEVYDSDEDEDYDLSPDEDELDELEGESDDELDGLSDPARITEIDTDEEEEAPKLVKAKEETKGKKKRSADELESASLDDISSKSIKSDAPNSEEPKLSKKQLKKQKKNNGEAAASKVEENKEATPVKADAGKTAKKVEFAAKLVQGPTPSAEKPKAETKDTQPKSNVTTIDGVKIDDKKIGSGPAAKDGDRCGMRYIGKLADGKVFDSNKKGKPFSFKLGKGEVIKGWEIGIRGMKVGGERRLTIPARHAYGSTGVPGIPGNATLTFDIKLLEIK